MSTGSVCAGDLDSGAGRTTKLDDLRPGTTGFLQLVTKLGQHRHLCFGSGVGACRSSVETVFHELCDELSSDALAFGDDNNHGHCE